MYMYLCLLPSVHVCSWLCVYCLSGLPSFLPTCTYFYVLYTCISMYVHVLDALQCTCAYTLSMYMYIHVYIQYTYMCIGFTIPSNTVDILYMCMFTDGTCDHGHNCHEGGHPLLWCTLYMIHILPHWLSCVCYTVSLFQIVWDKERNKWVNVDADDDVS